MGKSTSLYAEPALDLVELELELWVEFEFWLEFWAKLDFEFWAELDFEFWAEFELELDFDLAVELDVELARLIRLAPSSHPNIHGEFSSSLVLT